MHRMAWKMLAKLNRSQKSERLERTAKHPQHIVFMKQLFRILIKRQCNGFFKTFQLQRQSNVCIYLFLQSGYLSHTSWSLTQHNSWPDMLSHKPVLYNEVLYNSRGGTSKIIEPRAKKKKKQPLASNPQENKKSYFVENNILMMSQTFFKSLSSSRTIIYVRSTLSKPK